MTFNTLKKYCKLIYTLTFISLIVSLASACNSEFSKYEKLGENDIEKAGLKGEVRECVSYLRGELTTIKRYNRYGFKSEVIDYDDGKEVEHIKYVYNEYGKIVKELIKNKNRSYEIERIYDEHQNVVREVENTVEVYNSEFGYTKGKVLLNTYENKYDDLGGLISIKLLDRNGTCLHANTYTNHGRVSREEFYTDGKVSFFIDFMYNGTKLLQRKVTSLGYDKFLDEYTISKYDSNGRVINETTMFENNTITETISYFYGNDGFLERKVSTHLCTMDAPVFGNEKRAYKKGDVMLTTYDYENDRYGNILKKTDSSYKANEDITGQIEFQTVDEYVRKYDSVGNEIYYEEVGHDYIVTNEYDYY